MNKGMASTSCFKKELQKHYYYLSRGSSLIRVKKQSLRILGQLRDKIFFLSGKTYLAKVNKGGRTDNYKKKEIVRNGKKHVLKGILQKVLLQNKISFLGEDFFEDPSAKCKIIKKDNYFFVKPSKRYFPHSLIVSRLNNVKNKIHWPEVSWTKNPPSSEEELVSSICEFFLSVGVARQGLMGPKGRVVLEKQIRYFVSKKLPIRISFYLFCGKIGNPSKVFRRKPSLADYYALCKLVEIERALAKIYCSAFPFSLEWFIIDQTRVQRFDIPAGEEEETRKIYQGFIKRLKAEEYIHLVPWESLIKNERTFFKETNRLQKIYCRNFKQLIGRKRLKPVQLYRAERMSDRVHSALSIVNPFLFPQGKIELQDLLVLYNDHFPGLHFNISSETPFQVELSRWVEKNAVKESAQYLASLEARGTVKGFAREFPKVIAATITRKKGRLVLDYLGNGRTEGTRFFPDVGETVVLPNKEIAIMPYLTILSYPQKFTPVYVKEFGVDTPFFWLAEGFRMNLL